MVDLEVEVETVVVVVVAVVAEVGYLPVEEAAACLAGNRCPSHSWKMESNATDRLRLEKPEWGQSCFAWALPLS